MSASKFTTLMACDMRTGPDGKAQFAEPGTGQPRWIEHGRIVKDKAPDGGTRWFSGMCHAETALYLAAQAIREQPMDGLTGDHPAEREALATAIERLARLTRVLALDADHDATFSGPDDPRWETP